MPERAEPSGAARESAVARPDPVAGVRALAPTHLSPSGTRTPAQPDATDADLPAAPARRLRTPATATPAPSGAAREPSPTAGLRRPVIAGVVGKAAEAVTLVLLATVVPRLLGPADYGRLSVVLTLVAVGSVALTLGGSTLLGRYVPAASPARRPALARAITLRLARNRVAAFALLAVVGAVLVATGRFPAAVIAWVLLALALNVAATLLLQADLGLGRAAAWSARYPVQNTVLIASVVALYVTTGVDGAIAGVAVAGAAGLALALAATASLWRAPICPSVHLPAGAARFGLMAAATGALTQVVQRGGVIAAALLGTVEATGHAAVAIGVALAATYAVAQVFVVTLPALTARHAAAGQRADRPVGSVEGMVADRTTADEPGADRADPIVSGSDRHHRPTATPASFAGPVTSRSAPSVAEPALRRLAGALLAVVLPVAVIGVLAVDLVVPVVLGPAYVDAAAAFPPALAAVVLAPLGALTLQTAALRLRPGTTLVAAAAAAVVFTVAAVLAVPVWGAAGAAGAMLIGTATAAVVGVLALPGCTGWRLPAASLAGAMAVAGWGVCL